jgi:hypothetical protein
MKIPEFKRSRIRLIAEFCRIPNGTPNQDCCIGKGKRVLNMVSNSKLDVHIHVGLLPNNHDGTLAIAFCLPLICIGVNGHACMIFKQSARAWTRCSTTNDRRDASQVAQLRVGELSLNSVMSFSWRSGHTPSMTSYSITNPTILRSEFVIVPVQFDSETMFCFMLSGHSHRKTTGVHADSSPTMTLPTP